MLDLLAVVAFTVSAFLALTVAGGMWMFLQRWRDPDGALFRGAGMDPVALDRTLEIYLILAVGALALVIIPVVNLGSAAARLGARGRASRLASLRLIGMTGSEVTSMSLIETLVQALAGVVVGAVVWLASLPAWQAVSFHDQRIGAYEMLPPVWVILTIAAVLVVLAAASTATGLRQVRISPLGVAMRQGPRALRGWRVGVFVLAIAAFLVFSRFFSTRDLDLQPYALLAVMVLIVISALNLVGPWVLQLLARSGLRTASVPRLIAMRRIIGDPRGAWRTVSAVALLGVIASYLSIIPIDPAALGLAPASAILIADLRTGALITLATGLLLAATSTLVNQAAQVVDRAEESISLDRLGMPRAAFAAVRRHQVLVPLVVTLGISVGVGLLLATPFMSQFGLEASGVLLIGATVLSGVALTVGVAELCRPLQHQILTRATRRND